MVWAVLRKIRAIVFEDDEDIRELMVRVLSNRGYDVFAFEHPFACNSCPDPIDCPCADIVISDVFMPYITGTEFVKKMSLLNCGIKNIALMSGTWTSETEREAQLYCSATFSKPMSIFDLVQWLERAEKNIDLSRPLGDLPKTDSP